MDCCIRSWVRWRRESAGELGLTNTQLGPIFSANLLGQCIGLVAVPMLAARMSQRTVVLLPAGIRAGAGRNRAGAGRYQPVRLAPDHRPVPGRCASSCLALVTAAAPVERRGFAIMVLFTGYGLGRHAGGRGGHGIRRDRRLARGHARCGPRVPCHRGAGRAVPARSGCRGWKAR